MGQTKGRGVADEGWGCGRTRGWGTYLPKALFEQKEAVAGRGEEGRHIVQLLQDVSDVATCSSSVQADLE